MEKTKYKATLKDSSELALRLWEARTIDVDNIIFNTLKSNSLDYDDPNKALWLKNGNPFVVAKLISGVIYSAYLSGLDISKYLLDDHRAAYDRLSLILEECFYPTHLLTESADQFDKLISEIVLYFVKEQHTNKSQFLTALSYSSPIQGVIIHDNSSIDVLKTCLHDYEISFPHSLIVDIHNKSVKLNYKINYFRVHDGITNDYFCDRTN